MFNVGVYGAPHGGTAFDPVELNRTLEARVTALGGRKMLYAQSFYTREEFWKLFDRDAYEQARTAAHASDLFADVADKLLMRPARLEQLRGVKAVSFAHCFWSMADMVRWRRDASRCGTGCDVRMVVTRCLRRVLPADLFGGVVYQVCECMGPLGSAGLVSRANRPVAYRGAAISSSTEKHDKQ